MLLEITEVLLCVGLMQQPDFDRCLAFNDTRGPYETVEACQARLDEIAVTWPPIFSQSVGGGPVSIFWPTTTCTISGEEA